MKIPVLLSAIAVLTVLLGTASAGAEPLPDESATNGQAAEDHLIPTASPRTPVARALELDPSGAAHAASRADIQCLSGGIGEGEAQAMDAHASAYNLKTLFVSQGAYLSSVALRVSDSKGQPVFKTLSKGPMVLLRLPPGRYLIEAKGPNGAVLEQRVAVGATRLSSLVFRFPASEL